MRQRTIQRGAGFIQPQGTVEFFDGSTAVSIGVAPVINGVATLDTTTISATPTVHSNIFAVYTDNNDTHVNFNVSPNSNSVGRTVNKANTSINLPPASPQPSAYGQQAVSATVTTNVRQSSTTFAFALAPRNTRTV